MNNFFELHRLRGLFATFYISPGLKFQGHSVFDNALAFVSKDFHNAVKEGISKYTAKIGCMISALLLAGTASATVYTVNSISDANSGSGTSGTLRYCIAQANADISTPHTINFNISGTGPFTIILTSNLPPITKQTTINGYSQSGASQGTISGRTIMIVIASNNNATVGYPLSFQASNCAISGIAFQCLHKDAAMLSTYNATSVINNVWVWGCYFNTDAGGNTTTGEGYSFGVYGNTNQSSNTKSNLKGWIIGTNSDGSNDANEGNLFSHPPASATSGYAEPIRLFMCDSFIIAGNTLGLKKDGTTPLQTYNTTGVYLNYGIVIVNCTGTRIGTDGNGTNDAGERNVFAGMRSTAIIIFANLSGGTYFNDGNTSYDNNRAVGNNLVAGNYFGTDITGMATGANLRNRMGIVIDGSSYNTVGSVTNTAMKNIIVNTDLQGIQIVGDKFNSGNAAPSNYNIIAGNYIGVLANGSSASGNTGTGINIKGSANLSSAEVSVANTSITKNIIANNSAGGIALRPVSAASQIYDNTISQNSIYANTGLGINLGSSATDIAVTPNDGVLNTIASSGTNANLLMDYGVIVSASLSGNNLTIKGYIGNNATGTTAFGNNAVVEFFIADNSPADQNGEKISGDGLNLAHGEGKIYLGSLTANSNALFSGTIDVTGKGFVAGTSYITNTVTEYTASGSTSEFGVNVIPVVVSGKVYNDSNGLKDNAVNGSGTNGGGLNAVLYDNTVGIVTNVVAVSSGGSYSLNGGISGSNYSLYITTATVNIGQTMTPSVVLPAGWVSTGEYHGSGAGNDSTVNGILPLGYLTSDIINANFGIERLPDSDNKSSSISQPFPNQFVTLNGGGSNPPVFTGSDPEDQPASDSLSLKTVGITSPPSNGQLWYNGVQIIAGSDGINPPSPSNPFIISSFTPSYMQIKLTGSGYLNTSFTYAYIDRAGKQDASPATYTVDWPLPLPVHFMSFEVVGDNDRVDLLWQTAMEKNNEGFEVQHSSDKKIWVDIGFVKSINGNSDVPQSYSYYHHYPSEGVNYYRLKQIDFNQNVSYSAIRQVDFEHAKISVFPNPVNDRLNIIIPASADMEAIQLVDEAGRLVYQSLININTIDMSPYESGIYFLYIQAEGVKIVAEKIIKQD